MNKTSAVKKWTGTAAAAVAILFAAAPSHAVFTRVSISTVAASVTVGGTGVVAINSVIVKKIADNSVVSNSAIGWVGANAGSGFLLSDAYIQLRSTTTTAGSGVQIYTNNMATNASPKFLGDPTQTNPAGLVSSDGSGAIPLAWSVRLSTNTVVAAVDPNNDPAFAWSFFEDAGQQPIPGTTLQPWSAVQGTQYVTVKNPSGVQTNNTHFFGGSTATGYIYTEADFSTTSPGVTYGSNKITLEAFTQ